MENVGLALILEDDPAVSSLIKEVVVEETNLWPIVVTKCEEALRIMQREENLPSLVVLDYALVGDNFECMRRLKQYRETRQPDPIPVVLANKALLVLIAEQWLHVLEKPVTYARIKAILKDKENSTSRLRGEKKSRQRRKGI